MVIKVILLGDGGVGKTTLASKAAQPLKIHNGTMTIFFETHSILINGEEEIIAFDFGGQEQFRSLLNEQSPLLAGANAALLFFDTNRFTTFTSLKKWLKLLEHLPYLPKALVGTKIDKNPVVSSQIIQEFVISNNFSAFFETSSIKNINTILPFKWALRTSKAKKNKSAVVSKDMRDVIVIK